MAWLVKSPPPEAGEDWVCDPQDKPIGLADAHLPVPERTLQPLNGIERSSLDQACPFFPEREATVSKSTDANEDDRVLPAGRSRAERAMTLRFAPSLMSVFNMRTSSLIHSRRVTVLRAIVVPRIVFV